MKTDATDSAANQPLQPSEEGFITKEVVAERLSVTPETVRRWASAGKLPSHHFGRRLRFKWSEVVAAPLANGGTR
ncbi:MAG: helix-turn-helix domain-containing protein [Verrucomicrobiota bacterium]